MAVFVFSHSDINAPTLSVNNIITYNTIYNCSTPISLIEPNRIPTPDELNIISNNLFFKYTIMKNSPIQTLAILTNNGWFSGVTSSNGIDKLDAHPVIGLNPVLRDISIPNFTPLEASPLINQAIRVSFVTSDIRGVPRPQGVEPDIGAYERLAYEL